MNARRLPIFVRPGFTLVEMLLVVAIIALLLTMVVPGFTRTWEERKQSQAVTLLNGLLASTRAKAIRHSEQGLFFYLDPTTQRQMVIPIVPDPPDASEYVGSCVPVPTITECVTHLMAENRFRPVDGNIYEMPAPIRSVPRSVVDLNGSNPVWPEEDLAHERFNQPAPDSQRPRHRNFFTVIFGPDGRLVPGRDVIIHEKVLSHVGTGTRMETGEHTKLRVGNPTDVYPADASQTKPLDPGGKSLFDIIVEVDDQGEPQPNAINFTSVDGLLVYDESVLADIPYAAGQDLKRRYLVDHARPIYVSPLTGEVLQGPMGENQ